MHFDIKCCLKCNSKELIQSYPIIICKKCKAIFNFLFNEHIQHYEVECVKFHQGLKHVCIKPLENKSYINGDFVINKTLPFDISDEKLNLYLTFS